MALQKSVNASQPLGFAGHIAKGIHNNFFTISGVAVDDKIKVGEFVQATSVEGEYKGVGQAVSGRIAGLCIFEGFQNGEADSNVIANGQNITLLTAGAAYIRTDKQATAGQYVMISEADGTLSFDDSKSTSGKKYTGFVVEKGNSTATDGIVLITTALAYV